MKKDAPWFSGHYPRLLSYERNAVTSFLLLSCCQMLLVDVINLSGIYRDELGADVYVDSGS